MLRADVPIDPSNAFMVEESCISRVHELDATELLVAVAKYCQGENGPSLRLNLRQSIFFPTKYFGWIPNTNLLFFCGKTN
eukprot:18908_4